MNLLTLFVCINFGMSILSYPGTPFYAGGESNCYFPVDGAPSIDPTTTLPGGLLTGTSNITNVQKEFITPTNSTLTDVGWLGSGNPFNAFTDAIDQASKTMEIMKNIIGGGYIMNVVNHFSFNCSYDENGNLVDNGTSPVWDGFIDGFSFIVILLTIFTLFYWITGRGHILTS